MRLTLAVLALLVAAPAALADDAAVFAAYNARQPRMDALSRTLGTAYEDRRFHAVIRIDRRMNGVLSRIAGALSSETASTAAGRSGQRLGVKEVLAWRKANLLEIRANRAGFAGKAKRSDRLIRRATHTMRHRTFPSGRKAVRAFKRAGLTAADGAVSGKLPG